MPAGSNIILKNEYYQQISLEIKGTAAQEIGNLATYGHTGDFMTVYDMKGADYSSMIINTCDNVTVTGTYTHTLDVGRQTWCFLSLPFDFKVGDIVTENDVKFAIRYYDGASRATTSTASGNWKNYGANDIVTAGTGFIFQASQDTKVTFTAQANSSRNNSVSNTVFNKALAANDCSDAAHKGWNMVGNPWQCYYNIHKLNFTAPISVWKVQYGYGTYEAYSIEDDDYALRPNEAFFVQCPTSVNSIGFPVDGRQLTNEITSQNGARQMSPTKKQRWLVDVQIENTENMRDKTRLVVNPEAAMDYEINCDASKFMTMDANVPQIYSLDQSGTQYAINERPLGNGTQRLGVLIQKDGQHTIQAVRNTLGHVMLYDSETGITTDLMLNGYVFDAKAGYYENRFSLNFNGSEATGISSVHNADEAEEEVYTLDGRRTNNQQKGIYVVRKGQKTQKVIVK